LPAIFATVAKSKEAVADACDALVDAVTEGELLNRIPVLGTAIKLLDVKDSFTQNRLKRNCIAFMTATAGATSADAENARAKILEDSNYELEFADTILSILLESEKPIKCELVGKLLIAFARDAITADQFETLCLIVQAASVPSLSAVPKFFAQTAGIPYSRSAVAIPQEPLLFAAGLATRAGTMFRISEIGKLLFIHGFDGVVVG